MRAASHRRSRGLLQPSILSRPQGKIKTPWGSGEWGAVDAAGVRGGKPTLWATVGGALCVLEFEDGGTGEAYGMFISTRCGDQDLVVGRVMFKDSA